MGRRRAGKRFAIRKAIAVAAGNSKRGEPTKTPLQSELKILNVYSLCEYWWNNTIIPIPEEGRQLPEIVSIERITYRIYVVSGNPPIVRLFGGAFKSADATRAGSTIVGDRTSEVSTVPVSPDHVVTD